EYGQLRFTAPPNGLSPKHFTTIRALRPRIIDWLARQAQKPVAEIADSGRDPEWLPVTGLQAFLVLSYLRNPSDITPHIRIDIRATGAFDLSVLRSAVQELTKRHAALRARFTQMLNGDVNVAVDEAAEVPISVTDLSQLPQSERDRAAFDVAQ